jgi:hypothetical protein
MDTKNLEKWNYVVCERDVYISARTTKWVKKGVIRGEEDKTKKRNKLSSPQFQEKKKV